ncbi:hypothetical protein TUMEXPCC7403_01080 [Tumidithrix helvetica PCC 7403]|uniref:eCIS core domain-containing protein n=1 Tax=Tumidithrix helvetica TaxID=3457545 RepID=UPI003C9464CD
MGRYRTSAKKKARQDRESQPSFTVNTLQMRPFAPPQESQVQPQSEDRTAELGHRLENISFQPRPQVDIMARKWEGIRAAYQAKQVQAKLAIGAVGDKYEQEADKVASQVVQTINTPESVQRDDEEQVQTKPLESIQRDEAPEEEDEELQMKPLSDSIQREEAPEEEDEELQMKPALQQRGAVDGGDASEELESSIQQAKGSGQPLDPNLQEKMGQAMGADFSSVKVHTDSQSDQLNQSIQAKAFTTGQDVFFRQGAYNPSRKDGQELIAHELTHVVQQNGGAVQRKCGNSGDTSRKIFPKPIQPVTQISQSPNDQIQLDDEEESIESQYNKSKIDLDDEEESIESQYNKSKIDLDDENPKKLKHEGSAKSAFDRCGHLIDTAVPDVGDKSKLEVELKIPVEPSGVGFVGMRLLMQCERKKAKQLNTRCELTVTGGAKIGGLAELKAEIGGYFESEGEDSKMVMRMISYAIYRRFVESSVLPVGISNYMWGGSLSNDGYDKAEKWAAKVEKKAFGEGKKNYVETGALLGGTASGGIKSAGGMGLSGKIGVKNSIGNRYDHKSLAIGRGGKEHIGKRFHTYSKDRFYTERGKEFSKEGKSRVQPKIGRAAYQLEVPFEGKAGIFKVSGKLKVVALEDTSKRKRYVKDPNEAKGLYKRMGKDEISFEVGAEVQIPFTKNVLDGAPAVIGGLLDSVVKIASQTSEKKKVGQKAGIIKSMAEDIGISAIAMNNVTGSAFKFVSPSKTLNELGNLKDSCSGTVGVKLGYKGKYKPGDASGDDLKEENKNKFKKSALSQEISLDYVKTGTFVLVDKLLDVQENLIDAFSFKQESSSRLFILRYEKGGDWVINPETALEYTFKKKTVNNEDNIKSQPKNSDKDELDWEAIYDNVYGKNKTVNKETNSNIKKRKKRKKRRENQK